MTASNSRWNSSFVKKAVPFITAAIGFFWYRSNLRDTLSIHQNLYEHHPDSMVTIDKQARIISVNEKAIQTTKFKRDDLQGKSIYTLFPFKKSCILEDWIKNPETGTIRDIEGRLLTKQGIYRDVIISMIKTLHNQKEATIHLIIEDITDKKRQEDHIKFLAYHDELTSLPNRRILTMLIKRLINKEKSFSVMLMDFDGFKQINDRFGHAVGDQVLREIGNKLVELSQGKAVVGRLGGDEFLVVFPESDCTEHAKKIVEGFHEPLNVVNINTRLTASAGIASYPEHAHCSNELLEYADIAMYQVKRMGGNGYRHYTSKAGK